MVGLVWIIAWASSATTVVQLVTPGLAAAVRVFYVDRKFPAFESGVWLLWVMFFVLNVAMSDVQNAARFSGAILISATLLTHMARRFRYSGAGWPRWRARVFQWYRAKELVFKRFRDLSFVIEMRAGEAPFASLRKVTMWASALPGAVLDLVALERQTRMLIESRGGIPQSQDWLSDQRESGMVLVTTDVCLLCLALVAVTWGTEELLPPPIVSAMRLLAR